MEVYSGENEGLLFETNERNRGALWKPSGQDENYSCCWYKWKRLSKLEGCTRFANDGVQDRAVHFTAYQFFLRALRRQPDSRHKSKHSFTL